MTSNIQHMCIKCEKQIEMFEMGEMGDKEGLSANDAIIFTSNGNYGSTVLDLSPTIQIYICDDCFRYAANNKMVIQPMKRVKTFTTYDLYHPDF